MQLDFSQWIVTLHRDVILGIHNSLKGICMVVFFLTFQTSPWKHIYLKAY